MIFIKTKEIWVLIIVILISPLILLEITIRQGSHLVGSIKKTYRQLLFIYAFINGSKTKH